MGSQHAKTVYMGEFVTKCKTQGRSTRIEEALAKLPSTSSARKIMFKVVMACLAAKQVSQQAQLYLIASLTLPSCSHPVESLCVSRRAYKRAHLASTAAAAKMSASRFESRKGNTEGDEDDDDPDIVGVAGRHKRGAVSAAVQQIRLLQASA